MLKVTPIVLDELEPDGELLQSALWGRFKAQFGWYSQPLSWSTGQGSGTILTLAHKTPLGLLVYIPGGPTLFPAAKDNSALLKGLAREISRKLHTCPTLIRYDLLWSKVGQRYQSPRSCRLLSPAPVNIQPTSTVLIDLSNTEKQLLQQMKAKTRYNIRLAKRHGVRIEVFPAAEACGIPLRVWYQLHLNTARRHRITAHSSKYFNTLFELAAKSASSEIYLLSATYCGQVVGGIVVSVCGRRARYLYGASTSSHRHVMANYALQWTALKLARSQKCESYDFYGIPPTRDSNHQLSGLYRFKTGFGGAIVNGYGCWDYAVKPMRYKLIRSAELFRHRYYRSMRPLLTPFTRSHKI